MRLPNNVRSGAFALGLIPLLAGCGVFGGGGGDRPQAVAGIDPALAASASLRGPEADYPVVLGDPFTVDGQLYTPADTLSYDSVGYASLDRDGGQSVTVAHKTLPLPSYVEITELGTGRTILARVERRGPMTGAREVALSPGAAAQLGVSEGAPVRVRRVNPPEIERAELRAGKPAPARMDTPKTLLGVLTRKLPAAGSASLRSASADAARVRAESSGELPAMAPRQAAVAPVAQPSPAPRDASFEQAFSRPMPAATPNPAPAAAPVRTASASAAPAANSKYALPPLTSVPRSVASPATRPIRVSAGMPPAVRTQPAPQPAQASTTAPDADDGFVVQAAAFSSKTNADRAANKIGGFVEQSGKYYRVRTGPYTSRGQAEAALAKVRAAGYSDARVFTAG
ncbi:MAG: SPOR domain-containing protein [Sphingomonadaceae bacterium]|nr:SPOR domain-containing protein [Sphingomonadaceae bacterium]